MICSPPFFLAELIFLHRFLSLVTGFFIPIHKKECFQLISIGTNSVLSKMSLQLSIISIFTWSPLQ